MTGTNGKPTLPEMNLRIIFINGFGRSGTTLLMSLLDGHPSLVVCPLEMPFIEEFHQISGNKDYCDGNVFVRYILEDSPFRHVGGFARTAGASPFDLTSVNKKVFQHSLDVLKDRQVTIQEAFSGIAHAFSEALYGNKVPPSKSHFAMKMNDLGRLNSYLDLFPDAKTVLGVRHPMPYFESRSMYLYKAYKSNRPPHLAKIIHEDNLVSYEDGLEQVRRSGTHKRCLINKLEDMHADLKANMGRIAEFIGIPYHDALVFPTILNKPYEGNTVYEHKRSTDISQYRYDRTRCPFQEYVVSHRVNPEPLYRHEKSGVRPSLWSPALYRLTQEEKLHWKATSIFSPIGRGGRLARFVAGLPSIIKPLARGVINPLLWTYRLKELPLGYIRYRKWLSNEAAKMG
ncbi:MAG: sulfotransferase [Candidatus Zixiibacteriota bacterium]